MLSSYKTLCIIFYVRGLRAYVRVSFGQNEAHTQYSRIKAYRFIRYNSSLTFLSDGGSTKGFCTEFLPEINE